VDVACAWRGGFENDEVNRLHAEGFSHEVLTDDWRGQVDRHSLGWVTARDAAGTLVGFVNVPWDGGVHAFILDTVVPTSARRQGIGRLMIVLAAREAKAAGCEWLHADYDECLIPFYEACGFKPTPAGVMAL
jgi:GNAT superfamily N-acetyltransferase